MILIRNTLVFLDTNFWGNYKTTDQHYRDILKYSREEKIVLCTSEICLEEWRAGKVKAITTLINGAYDNFDNQVRINPIAFAILSPFPVRYPSIDEVKEQSKEVVTRFVADNKIRVYKPTEKHIERTWKAYFEGLPPFSCMMNRKDIPDSWIFEAARDARFNDEANNISNKFCIGNDKTLNQHLGKLGLKPIKKYELLEQLQIEEEHSSSGIMSQQSTQTDAPTVIAALENPPVTTINNLESLLSMAISTDMQDIYIRILGYAYWLSDPRKEELFTLIENRGFNLDLIKAGAAILSQESLGLIKDTGNHLLPLNDEICKEAADSVMDEIIGYLDQT